MTSSQIRAHFFDFFRRKGHVIVPSAPVIPYDDPTLLFTNAGMNQFKDVFLGTGRREYVRAADSQKCIRVSGKHNDLEEVGRDTYHHTFFEMLGNWSFGDYYKAEAIAWAWELLTKEWGLEKRRLYATVYETDEEAEGLWKRVTDIDPSHVLRFGKKDNFWEMGETGPCGPCSEIHLDRTADFSGGSLVNAGDPRVMEIWNLVFIQYDRNDRGELTPLPAKHVDTGMGFERICAVLQGKSSNYETDVFSPIIGHIAALAGRRYEGSLDGESDIAMRVIADHVRMLSFAIADGAMPSNEGRGYVMRRILRRAARFGRTLGMHEPFIHKAVEAVAASMGDQYPEIRDKRLHIERVIHGEEESFNATLDRGLEIFASVAARLGGTKVFPGEEAFKLYDTFGFPLDLTELMARERGYTVDTAAFNTLMEEQRDRARQSAPRIALQKEWGIPAGQAGEDLHSEFVGYRDDEAESRILALSPKALVIDGTPFYAEAGGQVGDTGTIASNDGGFVFSVRNTQKDGPLIVHIGSGPANIRDMRGASVRAAIDRPRRRNIERNHTATHLVHEALRRVLGTHAHQQGSLVAPDHLRFDFNHFEKISPEELRAIEDIVNEKIGDDIPVVAINDPKEWLTIEEAKRRYPNVKMFFGDKYGDRVRIVEIDPQFSVELCGGTHVRRTGEIGVFKIVSEASIASGIRRIEAVTGAGLRRYIDERIARLGRLDEQLARLAEEATELERQLGRPGSTATRARSALVLPEGAATREALHAVDQALAEREGDVETATKRALDARKELGRQRVKDAAAGIDALVRRGGASVDGITVVAARIDVADADALKSLGDTLRARIGSGVGVLGAVIDNKVALVCVVTDDLTKRLQAGRIVGELAKRVGGGGGGKPHLATAGGKDVEKLDDALGAAPQIVKAFLG